jgi:membrane protein YdbS with pleckstrin-like domain
VFGLVGGELTARGWGYALSESMLIARRGPIRRVTVAMPLDRAQAADLSTGPVQRRWNLATLRVGGAGGQNVVTITDQTEPRMRSVLARCLPSLPGPRQAIAPG